MLLALNEFRSARFIGQRLLPMVCSTIVTFVCIYVMQLLIANVPEPLEIEAIRFSTNIVSLDKTEQPREMRKKPERTMPSEPPSAPKEEGDVPIEMISRVIGEMRIRTSLAPIIDQELTSASLTAPISDLVPIQVIHPIYPFKALMRQIEGTVLVEFSVTENGRVINSRVVSANPEHMFDKAALKAIQGFRFRAPSFEDGTSFAVIDMRLEFHFRLEDEFGGIALSESEPFPLQEGSENF